MTSLGKYYFQNHLQSKHDCVTAELIFNGFFLFLFFADSGTNK